MTCSTTFLGVCAESARQLPVCRVLALVDRTTLNLRRVQQSAVVVAVRASRMVRALQVHADVLVSARVRVVVRHHQTRILRAVPVRARRAAPLDVHTVRRLVLAHHARRVLVMVFVPERGSLVLVLDAVQQVALLRAVRVARRPLGLRMHAQMRVATSVVRVI